MSIDSIIDTILKHEGGAYTDHPADKGGPTKYGITLKAYSDFHQYYATAEDIRNLTEDEARVFYRTVYIEEPKFHKINDPLLQELVVDSGVNHGVRRAAKWLQFVAKVRKDGVIGPVTLRAVNTAPAGKLYLRYVSVRGRFYGRIISRDRRLKWAKRAGFRLQAEFAAGWSNRLMGYVEKAAHYVE